MTNYGNIASFFIGYFASMLVSILIMEIPGGTKDRAYTKGVMDAKNNTVDYQVEVVDLRYDTTYVYHSK